MLPLRRHRRLAAVLVLLGAAGAAFAGPLGTPAGAQAGGPSSSSSPECELQVSRGAGSVELLALAHAPRGSEGEYDLRVSGRGTDIRQGGPFAIGLNGTAELGMVTLGTGGAAYSADLEIKIGGKTIACSRRIGGGI